MEKIILGSSKKKHQLRQEELKEKTSEVFCCLLQVVFEALLANGPEGDIALDDITVSPGSCVEVGGKSRTFQLF